MKDFKKDLRVSLLVFCFLILHIYFHGCFHGFSPGHQLLGALRVNLGFLEVREHTSPPTRDGVFFLDIQEMLS